MRYVNAIFGAALGVEPFRDITELRQVVVPSIMGLIGDDALGARIGVAQGRQVLRLDGLSSHIQHATVQTDESEFGLILDIDTYSDETAPFNTVQVTSVSEQIHTVGLALFQHCVLPSAWEAMEPLAQNDASTS